MGSNLGSGQCKTGFLAIQQIWHSMLFFSMTILVVRPRPMHQMTRHQNKKSPTIQEKKKLDLAPKSWRLTVGISGTRQVATRQTRQPPIHVVQIWDSCHL